ncbi:MAG: PAS domain S-box protein [Bacteroidota bacterium]
MITNQYPGDNNDSLLQYQQIFDESPVPKYIFDLETFFFLAVNDATILQYGYTREEFLSMKITELRPDDEEKARPLKEVLSRDPDVTYADYGRGKHKRKNGEIFYVHVYAHTTRFKGKDAHFTMAIDIDQKVRTQIALEEKNTEIADILESVTDGFFAVNARWEVTFMNSEAEQMLKWKREELLGKNLWEYFPQVVGSRFYIEYNRVMSERVSTYFEEYYPALDLWIAMRAYPSREGLVAYFVEITEQKRIQEKIEKDEQNLRAIINNTTDMIWSIDKNYDIISANEPFNRRMELITGRRIDRISHGEFPEHTQRKWIEFYKRGFLGESFKTIWHEQLPELDLYEEISFNPIIDDEGDILGLCCISRDITENYLYTKRIEEQNDQLRKIAWIQSHEVRAPLSDILGLVGLIREGIIPGHEQAGVIDLIGQAANKLDTVIAKTVLETQRKDEQLL